ncbi:MAG TPA: hypothetical protein VNE40_01225 [Candidatus Dormibacteraeota bacterium]|nr:hypothetical protein [Candidatus Dormibacteraeota bacterium]
MRRFFGLLTKGGMPLLTACLVFIFLIGLLFFRLSSLTSNLASPIEIANKNTILNNLMNISGHDMLNGPWILLTKLLFHFHHSLLVFRLSSVFFGLVALALVYYILKTWHGYKIASLGVLLFGAGSWFLFLARFGSPDILQATVPLILIGLMVILGRQQGRLQFWLWLVALAFVLYIPGALWLAITAVALQVPKLRLMLSRVGRLPIIFGSLTFLVLLAPLIIFLASSILSRGLAGFEPWLGIKLVGNIPIWSNLLHNIINLALNIFWHTPTKADPSQHLDSLPALDVIQTAFALVGLIIYSQQIRQKRWQANLILLAVSWLVVGLGVSSPAMVLPIIVLMTATGIAYLLHQWYRVFPLNPLARSLGLSLIVITVSLSSLYNSRLYLVAWSNNPTTKTSFKTVLQPERQSIR